MSGLTAAHVNAALKAAGAGGGLVMPAGDIAAAFNDAILRYGGGKFATVDQVAALVSECMMESAWFGTTEEYAKNGRYAPFIGRTFIQLTWRDNYARFGAWCHDRGLVPSVGYFVDHPARLADLKWAALGGVWYFTEVQFRGKPLTAYAHDIAAVGRAVNLGDPLSKATPNGQRARDAAYRAVRALGSTIVPKETSTMNTERILFRGGLTCSCVVESLPWVELDMLLRGIIREAVDIYQLGYNPGGVAASAGAHDEGCMIDVGQYSDQALAVWRRWGYEIQHRTRAQGFAADHGHGGPKGCPHGSPLARQQLAAWENGRNGLRSNGPITGPGPKGAVTPYWKTALKENKMALLDELTGAVVDALKKDGLVNTDESALTGNPKNKSVAVTTALDYIGRRLMSLGANVATKGDVATLAKKIDALKATK